jgi:hypothetical protein
MIVFLALSDFIPSKNLFGWKKIFLSFQKKPICSFGTGGTVAAGMLLKT